MRLSCTVALLAFACALVACGQDGTSSSASSGGGSGLGGGGGAHGCDARATCGDTETLATGCVACAEAGPCAKAKHACTSSADCTALLACEEACASSECITACALGHQGSVAALRAWVVCVYCDACPNACSTDASECY